MRKVILTTIFLSLLGCSSFMYVELPLPIMNSLPKVSAEALQCLSLETVTTLKKRDIMWENHVDELESIIRSTH